MAKIAFFVNFLRAWELSKLDRGVFGTGMGGMGDFNIKVGNGWFPRDGTVECVHRHVSYIKKKIWPLSSKTDGLVAGERALYIRS